MNGLLRDEDGLSSFSLCLLPLDSSQIKIELVLLVSCFGGFSIRVGSHHVQWVVTCVRVVNYHVLVSRKTAQIRIVRQSFQLGRMRPVYGH